MTKHVTLASGDQIAYWTHHDDKKPTLILVHGFTGSHKGFQYLVPLLSKYRLIIPDLPGFGISPLPHEQITLAHLGEALVEFIEALKLDQPYVLGHSMGSLVVAEAVRQKPEILNKKIVLVSPVPSPVGIADLRRAGAILSQLYYILSHRLPVVGPKLATSKKITRVSTRVIMTTKDKQLRKDIHEHHFDNLNFISNIGWYSSLYRRINRTGISRYRLALKPFDVLIINGSKDSVTPLSHQQKTANRIGAKVVVLPNVGHLSHYETPDALATEMRGFLK
jgi:pimeloyl-ACP methyl ester carboxylesterase